MNPDRVEEQEKLGHGVFDSGNAGRERPRARLFEDAITHGSGAFSVDRLDFADLDVLGDIHDDAAKSRGENRSFYGWYSFTSDLVRSNGMDVLPSPSADPRNLWHADVRIPDYDASYTDLITQYANALKSESKWKARHLNRTARNDIEQASRGID
jgi:hypothetical protein